MWIESFSNCEFHLKLFDSFFILFHCFRLSICKTLLVQLFSTRPSFFWHFLCFFYSSFFQIYKLSCCSNILLVLIYAMSKILLFVLKTMKTYHALVNNFWLSLFYNILAQDCHFPGNSWILLISLESSSFSDNICFSPRNLVHSLSQTEEFTNFLFYKTKDVCACLFANYLTFKAHLCKFFTVSVYWHCCQL